ncbi:hypothetical protein JW823_03945 [bacterium]|nr:hypothetical protein [candidate division CSSED10-310 bacterium]
MKAGSPFNSIQAIIESIGRSDIKPVYLFSGEEDYLVHEACKQTASTLQTAYTGALVTTMEGENTHPQAVIQRLQSPSLFNPVQIVIIRDVAWFESGKSNQTDPLRDWLSGGAAGGVLILTSCTADKRLGITKLIKKIGVHLDFPKTKNFNQYDTRSDDYYPVARVRLQARGQMIEDGAWRVLRQKTPDSLWAVINALDVVSSYAGSEPRISIADVDHILVDHSEMPGYMVVQAFGEKDPVKIKEAIRRTLNDGIPPLLLAKSLSNRIRIFISIISMGMNKIRVPSQYAAFRDDVLPQLIAQYQDVPMAKSILTDTNPYALYQQLLQSRKFTIRELTDCMTRLAAVDKLLKSGAIHAQGVLETIIFPLITAWSSRS